MGAPFSLFALKRNSYECIRTCGFKNQQTPACFSVCDDFAFLPPFGIRPVGINRYKLFSARSYPNFSRQRQDGTLVNDISINTFIFENRRKITPRGGENHLPFLCTLNLSKKWAYMVKVRLT
jgi:hypothetical protein